MIERYLVRALLVFLAILSIDVLFKDIYMSHYLKLEISSDKDLHIQVFYDIGNGFNEKDSKTVRLNSNKNLSEYVVKYSF